MAKVASLGTVTHMADVSYLQPGRRRPRPLLRTLVGEVLRRHRQEQQRTLAEVARVACVSVPYLSEVERGRKEPSSEILAAICDSLEIELSDLLAEVRHDLQLARSLAPLRSLPPVTSLRPIKPAAPVTPPAHRPGDVVLLAA
jgi:transcriptional regulator with XRE-family HTH domain